MDRAHRHGERHRPMMALALRQRGGVAARALCAGHASVARRPVLDGDVETRRAPRRGAGVERARVVVVTVSGALAERPRRSADALHALAHGVGRGADAAEANADTRAAWTPVGRVDGEACAVRTSRLHGAALGEEVDRKGASARVVASVLDRLRGRAGVLVNHRDARPASPHGAQRQRNTRSHGPVLSLSPASRRKPITMRTLTR